MNEETAGNNEEGKNCVKQACNLIKTIASTKIQFSKNLFLLIQTDNMQNLELLALKLSTELYPDSFLPVYFVDCRQKNTKYCQPFPERKKGKRLKMLSDGEIIKDKDYEVLPQNIPIILLAEYFDFFDVREQRSYAHSVDGEGFYPLHPGSILIAGLTGKRGKFMDPGTLSRGICFCLEELEE